MKIKLKKELTTDELLKEVWLSVVRTEAKLTVISAIQAHIMADLKDIPLERALEIQAKLLNTEIEKIVAEHTEIELDTE